MNREIKTRFALVGRLLGIVVTCGVLPGLLAQTPATLKATMADVPYGKHERQVLDFYQAKAPLQNNLTIYMA